MKVSGGFGYAAAVLDGYSWKVLSLKVSNRMSGRYVLRQWERR